ncbi:hypothetical protein BH10PSE14_BH10PSE14_04370 [soil metagenome]
MTTIVDLIEPAQEAVFAALDASAALRAIGDVFVNVPINNKGSFALIGNIENEQDPELAEQFERITVEVQYIYRGDDRRVLLRMMAAGREAVDHQRLAAPAGIAFGEARFLKGGISPAAADGVTYAGIQNFAFYAQPA